MPDCHHKSRSPSPSVGGATITKPLRRLPPLRRADRNVRYYSELRFVESWRKTIAPLRSVASSRPSRNAAAADRVTIWSAPVQQLAHMRAYGDLLGPEDLLAISQMRCAATRDCTIAGRILLRTALSQAVENRIEPRDWQIRTGPNGKPVVATGWPALHFSISHTDQIAVVAVSETLPIGIDIETLDEGPSEDVIATCCCPSERLLFSATAPYQRSHEFIRLWTLKEAYAKMIGVGHMLDFASVGFSLDALHLLPGAPHQGQYNPCFETMWISRGRRLSHVSLAIGFSAASPPQADLSIINLNTNGDGEDAIHVPNLNIE
jgi:phosphopantetheinyl transferase